MFGKDSLPGDQQKAFLEGVIPDLQRVENLMSQIHRKAIYKHCQRQGIKPRDVYEMTAGTRKQPNYSDSSLYPTRIRRQLEKDRQVIAVQKLADGSQDRYRLLTLDKSVSDAELQSYDSFIIVKGKAIEVPEYLGT